MERIEADLHGWPQAPFTSKVEVDANFKRMIEYGCRPEHARAVHLGVASHNLFDVAHGLVLREERGRRGLGGVRDARGHGQSPGAGGAGAGRRAAALRAGGARRGLPQRDRLPGPPARREHRAGQLPAPRLRPRAGLARLGPASAIGSSAPSTGWTSCRTRRAAPRTARPRRRRRRRRAISSAPFANEPDTDWALAANREWIDRVRARWRDRPAETVPLQIGGALVPGAAQVDGRDRSRPARVAYRHALADRAQVSRALDVARAAQAAWGGRPAAERRRLLDTAAAVLARRRGDLIGAMIVDGAKTVPEADPEVSEAIDFARYYARALGAGDTVDGHRLEPLGVVVVAPPWNFPLVDPGRRRARRAGRRQRGPPQARARGGAGRLAPGSARSGRPAFRARCCSSCPVRTTRSGRGLITDPRVDAVILTGSVETARRFLEWRPDLRAVRGDQRQERDHRHRAGRSRPGRPRSRALGLRPRRPEVLGGQPRDLRGRGLRRSGVPPAAPRRGGEPRGGQRLGAVEPRHAADPAAGRRAAARADHARRGRGVAARAAGAEPARRRSGRRASSWACAAAPSSISTECFGPVLGLMRAADLDEAIDLANDHAVRAHQRDPVARRSRGRRAGSSASRPATSTSTATSPGPSSGASPSAAGRPRRSGRAPRPAGRTTCSSSAARRAGGTSRLRGVPRRRYAERGQLRARLAEHFSPGARADPPARRAQRVPVSPVPRACSCGARRSLRPADSRSSRCCSPRARAACR